jgi:hypothetical protein
MEIGNKPTSLESLSDEEVLALAAEGQEVLSEGTLVSAKVYRKLAQYSLDGNVVLGYD